MSILDDHQSGDTPVPSAALDEAGGLLARVELPELIDTCLDALWQLRGTDLILTAGAPPLLRVDGQIRSLEGHAVMVPERTAAIITELMGERARGIFERDRQVDFAFSWRDQARLRGNAFKQKGTMALALRMLSLKIPTMAELGLPSSAQSWADLPRGLVLVTGPTGSGKSTTLASMVDHINTHQARHIVTIEDPIEYYHFHKGGAVNQREVGADTNSFADGLRAVLREDPDVLLIGEMRDPESIQAALTIAETGTSCSRRCAPTTPARPSTASSTSSRPSANRRFACSWLTRWRACSINS